MNFDLSFAMKVAGACTIASSVAYVLATTPFIDTFFNCGATNCLPLRRRKKNRSWSLIQSDLIGNIDNKLYDKNDDISLCVQPTFTRDISHEVVDQSQSVSQQEDDKDKLHKFLPRNLLEVLQPKRTSYGFTLNRALREDPSGNFADLIAGDQEAYSVLSDLYDPIVSAENQLSKLPAICRYPFSFDPTKLSDSSIFDDKYISSIHFMVARSIKEYRFLPCSTLAEKIELQSVMRTVFDNLPHDMRGSYEVITEPCAVAEEALDTLEHNDCAAFTTAGNPCSPVGCTALHDVLPNDLYKKPDCGYYERAQVNQDWPRGCGIFTTFNGKTRIAVNRDDHIRIYHSEPSRDLAKAFHSLCTVYRTVQRSLLRKNLHFAYDAKYGFVNWSPSMIGCSMLIAVQICLPLLQKHDRFQALLSECHLRCDFETDCIIQLSLKSTYGLNEVEAVDVLRYGLKRLIEVEKMLEKGLCTELHMPSDDSHRRYLEDNDFNIRKCARLNRRNL
eukprot:gene13746-15182_t